MRTRLLLRTSFILVLLAGTTAAQGPDYRTLNDTFEPPRFSDAVAWKQRAAYIREHILASAGLMPMPARAPLNAEIFGEIKKADYTVSKVYFESLPGFLVTGNLYRPTGKGPFPAILAPHGHWAYGRLENTPLNSVPGRAISLARQGFVVFTFDMVGYGDSHQLPHTFGGRREQLWGLSLGGLQLWNAIRSLDFLESLPDVRKDALGATGESGGGTQTFLLAAVDDRVKVAVPVNMISLHMQGGCLCENLPGLRLDLNNVEIAAAIAPRPLLMVAATGDWTKNTLEREFPAVRAIYELLGASDRVHAERFEADHNYNRESREAMYAWMARWFKDAPAGTRIAERSFTPEAPADLLVFHGRALPPQAADADTIVSTWIDAARRQLAGSEPAVLATALRHALGYGGEGASGAEPSAKPASRKIVLTAGLEPAVEEQIRKAGYDVRPVRFTAFDEAAAGKIRHFETYNRTPASGRVADIVEALRAHPGAALVAGGDAALAGVLAAAIAPPRLAVLDVNRFDSSSDAAYLERLFIPGLRRAGGLETAMRVAGERVVIHDAGERFPGRRVEVKELGAAEIVKLLGETK